jgi:hypothetical protein
MERALKDQLLSDAQPARRHDETGSNGGVNPFALEGAKAALYNFKYVGKERIDELDLFVFDVSPKVMPSPKSKERVFVGRIWVDDHDLQIVKAKGKAGPETKSNKFPIVETYREQIDGKYWFPTYVYADDDLIFDNGTDFRVRMRVKYTDYRMGRGKVTITEVGEAPEMDTKSQSQAQTKPETQPTSQPTNTNAIRTPLTIKPPVEGGFMNGKAVDLPKAVYPEERGSRAPPEPFRFRCWLTKPEKCFQRKRSSARSCATRR